MDARPQSPPLLPLRLLERSPDNERCDLVRGEGSDVPNDLLDQADPVRGIGPLDHPLDEYLCVPI
jgi:hypothetical protein